MNKKSNILFIGDCSIWSNRAAEFLEDIFHTVTPIFWEHGMVRPVEIEAWQGDWIISFKSDLILSEVLLKNAKQGAINFHPAPPKYRGIGGYYYAIDNRDNEYGVTCHHMDSRIDHGRIIKVKRFEICPHESSNLLRERTAANCLVLFYEILILIAKGKTLFLSNESWSNVLYTRKRLNRYLEEKNSSSEEFDIQKFKSVI